MKKALIILSLYVIFTSCGGADTTVEDTTTTTVEDTTTTTVEDTTTTTVEDTTTTTVMTLGMAWEYYEKVTEAATSSIHTEIGPTSISKLQSRHKEVPKYAWEFSQEVLRRQQGEWTNKEDDHWHWQERVEIVVSIGPTTNLYFNENKEAIEKATDFWFAPLIYNMPEKYYAFFYSFGDLDWAINNLNSYGFYGEMARAPCGGSECSGANSGIDHELPHHGVGIFGINSPDSRDPYRYGPLHIHEFTHSAVAAQWIGFANNPQEAANQALPCWLNEGIAHFAGLTVGTDDYETYLEIRKSQVKGRHIQPPFDDYSEEAILNYYNKSIPGSCTRNPDYVLGYSIGYLTVEALAANTGPHSTMWMIREMANKDISFEEAFENTYGYSWNEAKPLLAEYISTVIGDLFKS